MKVILYMATTINGYIAKLDHDTPWSDAEFESYSSKVKATGNIIIGKTTHDLMQAENAFADLGEPLVVVVTSAKSKSPREKTIFVNSFQKALETLELKKFGVALICGGGKLDTAALESGKIEEVFIDIEPFIFGKGISLFAPSELNAKLKLISTTKIGSSGIQLHYKVDRVNS